MRNSVSKGRCCLAKKIGVEKRLLPVNVWSVPKIKMVFTLRLASCSVLQGVAGCCSVYIHIYVCIYIYVYVFTYKYIYVYIYVYVFTYKYIYKRISCLCSQHTRVCGDILSRALYIYRHTYICIYI